MMTHMTTTKVGLHRDAPRIYVEGKWLKSAGFEPGTPFDLSMNGNELILTAGKGSRRVSGKKDNTIPIIDINTADLKSVFGNADTVCVRASDGTIRISQTHVALLISSRLLVPREGSLFTGGGFLSLAASLAGFTPVFGVEINPDYAEIYERNHPGTACFNSSVEQVAWEELHAMRPIGLMTMGIPCEPYSNVRRLNKGSQDKRDMSLPPEAHELGDMFFWALRAIEAANPHTVVIEEVPGFLTSAAGYITQAVLRRLGYTVEARIIDPSDYGEIAGRKRAITVATSFSQVNWPAVQSGNTPRRLGDLLDPEPHEWWDRQTKPWPFKHWETQTAKGNGFEPPKLTAESTKVPTITKRYFAGQGGAPVVSHPTKPGTYRWFTINEVKRIHGIPESYDLGISKTTAGEVMGQGVLVNTFRKVIESVTRQKEVLQ